MSAVERAVVRVTVVSDQHGHLPEIEPCDLLLLGGDLCPTDSHEIEHQRDWLLGPFRAWLEQLPAERVVAIAGNHDFVLQSPLAADLAGLPWTYLEDETADVLGLRIHGSPWQPWFGGWAFNAPRGAEAGEAFLAERYALVPDDVDVLLVHGPPRGYGDRTASGVDAGSTALLTTIERTRPRLCAFGHIHEGAGRWWHGPSELVNATLVDLSYAPVHAPTVVELAVPERR
ncbi:metallophosphoesterase family protein [Patulibacter defluvii]|uniref:metallophosphoesterase family protein n=1 Tax=Patulibacter defluvii TaxID=3095358 RepID=UPI002A74751A|nr:metallophosphoesterase [Patulibacter sp. DM4]